MTDMTLGRWSPTYLLQFQFSFCRQWRPAKPRTGTSFSVFNCLRTLPTAPRCRNLDFNPMYGYLQSDLQLTSSDGTVPQSKDVERITSTLKFSLESTNFPGRL